MSRDTTVIRLRQPDAIDDPLSELAREGARRMLAQALTAEADAFVALWKDMKLPDGRDRVVRHGHGPERAIQTGVGPVEVRRAKVRDRGKVGAAEKIRFTSSILPKWARRTRSLDALLPILYLRGISTGDFQEALSALLDVAPGSRTGRFFSYAALAIVMSILACAGVRYPTLEWRRCRL